MQPHGKSLEVRLFPTNRKGPTPKRVEPPAAAEITNLTCSGCGKIGVSICARCCKKRGAIVRAHPPLHVREPALYRRLDQMSRLPLQEIKHLWDEFCIEINAEDFYEELPTFVEILKEGKWRTDALRVKPWLRENLVKRVKRSRGPEDYGPADARRRPSYPKFDRRNGALVAFGTQPFTEFEGVNQAGDAISSDEVIEGGIARKGLQTAGGEDSIGQMPADRDSLRFLDGLTLAERNETSFCALWADLLEQDKAAFDELLAETITNQQALVQRMGLDHDEAEVLAVRQLLWAAGPRMYLKFLDETNKKRLRNAWDRLDRKIEDPECAALFRQVLRESARNTRSTWWRKYWADYDLRMDRQGLTPPDAVPFEDSDDRQDRSRPKWDSSRGAGIPAEVTLRRHTQMDRDAGLLFPPLKDSPPDSDPSDDGTRLVDLGCDLTTKQRALYRSSAGKPKPHRKTKLYSE